MIPPYLDSEALHPGMRILPAGVFLARPAVYTVIDGDTFRIRTARQKDGKRHEAFRIRLNAVDTPELRKPALFDQVLRAGGFDPCRDGPGEMARDFVRNLCKGRTIMVCPVMAAEGGSRRDRYGRLIAQVNISGAPGDLFRLDGAFSLEGALLRAGLATVMPGHEAPSLRPDILDVIERGVLAIDDAMPMA